ncbi:hypothetical protein EG832_15525 [bacterium]|nr:hypothetical protein [bacterium]
MRSHQKRPGGFFVGLYAWITTIFVGAILLDIVYARFIPQAKFGFLDTSDFLLLIGFVTFLTGFVAIAFSMKSIVVRTLLIASLLVLSIEFIVPTFIPHIMSIDQINDLGPWLRIIPVGLSSILAFLSIYKFFSFQE